MKLIEVMCHNCNGFGFNSPDPDTFCFDCRGNGMIWIEIPDPNDLLKELL